MIKKASIFLKQHNVLFENFFSLTMLQAAGYILPLITLPYLVRVLGPDKFGLVAFAQAFVAYFTLITDYGFNLSATKEISINRDNSKKLSEIFCSVYIIKLILLILASTLFMILIFIIPRFKTDYLIYLFAFIIVIGNCLFPIWLFQGMEKMKYITIINVAFKTLFIIPIFVFVKSQSDFIYVPLINSLGFLVSGIIGFIFAIKIFGLELILPSREQIIDQFKRGWYIFISTIAISIYTVSNTFILGIFANNTIVGFYSAAEKIIKAVQGLIGPISQAVYPYISKLVSESKEKALCFLNKLIWLIGSGTFILSLTLFVFSDKIILLVLGPKYINSIIILRILAFIPFIVALSNVSAILGLMNFEKQKEISKVTIIGGIISICLTLLLVPLYMGIGSAISWIITELFITAVFLRCFYKLDFRISS